MILLENSRDVAIYLSRSGIRDSFLEDNEMRGIRIAALAIGLALTGLGPAKADDGEISCEEVGVVTPAEAASALQGSLPDSVTLGTGSEADIIAAFKDASAKNHGYASEIAGLIAIGRPDLIDALRDSVQSICAANAQIILNKIDQSAANPSADQLAALATATTSAPAAGPDDDGEEENEEEGDRGSEE